MVNKDVSIETGSLKTTFETAVALTDHTTNYTDIESLDQQVKSMMIFSENPNGKGRARICKVCGKEGSMGDIMKHIEANHITGISIPCDLCGKAHGSRNSLIMHKSRHHRKNKINFMTINLNRYDRI